LLDIVATPISPELLPLSENKSLHQSTEATIGPYELHDFFLYHFVRGGASPDKLRFLAKHAKFDVAYSEDEIEKVLATFLRRFFASQFKRSCVPDGPKVGTVSLSPRGDWRMPSDADPAAWFRR
jgi:NAD+ synthase (glutamine-hydrolysing)